MEKVNTFMYFAYGSNLLKKRIHLNNPSAEFVGIGRLDEHPTITEILLFSATSAGISKEPIDKLHYAIAPYMPLDWKDWKVEDVNIHEIIGDPPDSKIGHQLDFMKYSNHWRGASATIVPTADCPGAADRHIWGAVWMLHCSDMPTLDRQEGVHTNWYFPKTVTVISPEGESMECRTYQQSINPPLMGAEWDIPPERQPSLTYWECILQGAVECELPEEYIAKLKKIPHNGQEAPEMMAKLNK